MTRTLSVFTLGLLCAAAARADVAPPPGFKRVTVEHKITTGKDYPGYVFFAVSGGDKATPVKLAPNTPATITAGAGRYRLASLVAVPKDAAKKFESEKEFRAAVAEGKVAGLLRAKTTFAAFADVKAAGAPKTMVKEYKLEKIDPKEGIVLVPVKKAGAPGAPPQEESDEDAPDGPEVTAAAPRGRLWVAGLAAFAGLAFAGLWLARRPRN
jgi:hypothetical protein